MICQLIPNAVPNASLSLSFKQVTLKLAAGDGPVYLTGTHSQEIEGGDEEGESDDEMMVPGLVDAEAADSDEGEEESSDDEEEVDEDKMMEELAAAQANKLKTFISKKADKKASKPGPLSKKEEVVVPVAAAPVVEAAKVAVEAVPAVEEVEMEAEDDEESEDEEESAEADGKNDDDDEDDDDDDEVDSDDDDEEEEDDVEEGEDGESEEESEEEDEPVAPVSKKRKTEAETPVAVKNGKPAAEKKVKKAPVTPAKPNLNELKKKLLASPSLPKKYEKFANLMKNAHKITDDKEIKNTWEFLQKSKK